MTEEIVDIVNENDEVIGQELKSVCHEKDILHRISAVFVFNDKNQLLIQKRKKNGKYDHSAAGHVHAGETYEEAAKRELSEELGVELNELEEVNKKILDLSKNIHHICRLFLVNYNGSFNLQESEVDDVKFMSLDEINSILDKDPKMFCTGFKLSYSAYINWLGERK
jgi:isopentenyldiphosphate isomerase